LFSERSWHEQTLEIRHMLGTLAGRLFVPQPTHAFQIHAADLDSKPGGASWMRFAEDVYKWDRQIQDFLASWPSRGAAYQLGRGLAETYWALDPNQTLADEWDSWEFLLGARRQEILTRLITRLSGFVDPLTPPALVESLRSWGEVASNPAWRAADGAQSCLYEQVTLWRDLMRREREPRDLAPSAKAALDIGLVLPLLKAFRVQIVITLFSVAALILGASVIASPHVGVVVTVLGGLGITTSGLYARAATNARGLFERIRFGYESRLVVAAATHLPDIPKEGRTFEAVRQGAAASRQVVRDRLGAGIE
jgi:hypothetical protein